MEVGAANHLHGIFHGKLSACEPHLLFEWWRWLVKNHEKGSSMSMTTGMFHVVGVPLVYVGGYPSIGWDPHVRGFPFTLIISYMKRRNFYVQSEL